MHVYQSVVKSFKLAIGLWMDMDWSISSVSPSACRGQPPTDYQNFILDPSGSFWAAHGGQ